MLTLIKQNPLTLSDMQSFHQSLDEAKGFDQDFVKNVAYMVAEVGEVLNAFRHLKQTDLPEERERIQEQVAEELADCLAYVIKLANYADVDLEAAYKQKMDRNISRRW